MSGAARLYRAFALISAAFLAAVCGRDIGQMSSFPSSRPVALSGFDEEATATITHIGVLPEQRGNGYVDDVLAEANATAAARGFRAILSDVDVVNHPMAAAMIRAGHRPDVRPWHVWHYRS